jgi:DNA-binding HxlR family transcriptional regulator
MEPKPNSKSSPAKTMRAAGVALQILAAPLNVDILASLTRGPKRLLDLRQAVGSPPETTVRLYVRTLSEQGIIERCRLSEFPRSTAYELTHAGRGLLQIADVLEEWLEMAPGGPIRLGTTASKSAIKALTEGCSTNIVRAIAARRLSLIELSEVIPKINYPTLARRLEAMRLAGLVEAHPDGRHGTPYAATDWLRRAVIPAATAAVWEQRHGSADAPPIARLAVEAAFLLALPLLRMPSTFSGKCRLAVELQKGNPAVAGVLVRVDKGAVVSCSLRLDGEVEGWASGSSDLWVARMSGRDDLPLELGGDASMVEAILHGLASAVALSGPLNN